MSKFQPKKIFIEKKVADAPVTMQILNKLSCDIATEYIEDYRDIRVEGKTSDDIFKKSKEFLAIASKKGEIVKQFRCRDGIMGDTEYFISHGNNCRLDCEYCFLQCYFENAVPTVFVNHEEMLNKIHDVLLAAGKEKMKFHAGELCDALAFDDLTGLSQKLVPLFSGFPNASLELRTKTTTIENLLTVSAAGNVVVSWTFSPQVIIDACEHKAPSLEERIRAARDVQNAGYRVGVCLDPIILCENWLNHYKTMLERVFDGLDNTAIKFISLGGFRYLPSLAGVMRERNPQTELLLNEFVPCIDGKHRYFRPVRVEAYRGIVKIIRALSQDITVFLCMETPEVWNAVKDIFPSGVSGIPVQQGL